MARKQRRLSDEAAAVLELFLQKPEHRFYGREIVAVAGIPSGTLYPILIRLEERGILQGAWEPYEAARAGSRAKRRRYYTLDSMADAERALDEYRHAVASRELAHRSHTARPATIPKTLGYFRSSPRQ